MEKIGKHKRFASQFVPVTISTGISLSERFEDLRKLQEVSPALENLEQFAGNYWNRRVDYVDEEPTRPRSTSTPWKNPFKLVHPSPNESIHAMAGAFQFLQNRTQNWIPVKYRLSIPRDRYRWRDRNPHVSAAPLGTRSSYRPRNGQFGPPRFFRKQMPLRERIGNVNRYFGPPNRKQLYRKSDRRAWGQKDRLSKEKLDKEIDQYMSLTKSYLDKQLDQYIQEAKAAAAARSVVTGFEEIQAKNID